MAIRSLMCSDCIFRYLLLSNPYFIVPSLYFIFLVCVQFFTAINSLSGPGYHAACYKYIFYCHDVLHSAVGDGFTIQSFSKLQL